ncbi:MAG: ABC transporter permease [Bryobacteraceae bacterium]
MRWWKRPGDSQLNAEVRFHVEKLTEEKIAEGLSPEEARRQAILEFGGSEQVKENMRDVHRLAFIDKTLANLRYAFRFIRKSPTFSATVILTLALGIGGNTAVFSAIDAILLRPLPYPNADRLMVLHEYKTKLKTPESFVAPVRLEDWNRLNSTFQAICGYYQEDATESSGTLPEKVTEALVTPRFLQAMGISPELGRDFVPAEHRFGGTDAVLISDRYWRRRFHADPGAIGKRLRIATYSFTIVGVLPASFQFPDRDVDLWTAVPVNAPYAQDRRSTWYTAIGRLKPGVTLGQARADLDNVQAQLGRQYPATDKDMTVELEPLKEATVGGVRRSLWLVFGSVSLLLLIACTNITALLLARTIQREREISIRYSLGASRAAVMAQLLTETLVLAVAGALVGLALAGAGTHLFHNLAKSLPRAEEVTLDWKILLYALGCAVFATLLCGMIPSLRATGRSIASGLARGNRTQVSSRNPLQWALVGVQVALAVTLLIGAGLLLRSFQELAQVSPGFDPSHVLTFHVTGSYGETADMKKLAEGIRHTLNALRAMPGVQQAAGSISLPGLPGTYQNEYTVPDGGVDPQRKISADSRWVSPGYFAVVRIPVLAGEGCQDNWQGSNVVVNRSFATTYFGDSPAIGHHLVVSPDPLNLGPREIRGVVADAREQGINREPMPTVYGCVNVPDPNRFYLIRTHGQPMAMAHAIRQKLHEIEPGRSVFDFAPLEERISDSFTETRLRTVLLAVFAALALSLASIGLYGTLSYFVTIRQREIGLRLALGALRGQIVKSFVGQGLWVSVLGSVAGLCLAAVFARVLAGMLYGVSATDAVTFSSVVLLLLVVAAIASFIPAARAARTDPMHVLREE